MHQVLQPPLAICCVPQIMLLGLVGIMAAIFLFLIGKGLAAQRLPLATGSPTLIGRSAVARTRLAPVGSVFVDGSHWKAEVPPNVVVNPGQTVRIFAVDRLSLMVRPEAPLTAAGESQ